MVVRNVSVMALRPLRAKPLQTGFISLLYKSAFSNSLRVVRTQTRSSCGYKTESPFSTGYQFPKPDIISWLEEEEAWAEEEDSRTTLRQGEQWGVGGA